MTPTPDEDELEELPPLDGEAREPAQPEVDGEGEDVPAGEASLDDKTGEDDPVGTEELDLEESEKGWLGEPNDAAGLELGDAPLTHFADEAAAADDAEEPGVDEEDFGFGLAPERGDLDAGDEGPLDADEELRDEDLPALDADEAGDLDDAALVDPGFAADEPHGLPWAAAPWERVGAPVPVSSAVAIASADRGAIVAGRSEGGVAELLRVDLEGSSQVLAAEGLDAATVRALAGEGPTLEATLESGAVLVSRDGGESFVLLADVGARRDPVDPPEARVPPVRATRGGTEARAARKGGVVTRAPGGEWTLHPWVGIVTAVAFLDDRGTLLAATYSDMDDATALVRLDAGGHPAVVARLGASRSNADSDGRVLSMAHDEARGVVWLAGGFGVATFAVR